MSTTINPPAGIDGVVPIYNPNERWQYWNFDEIFWGPDQPGTGKYVPKVKDWIKQTQTRLDYEVESVDPTTCIPTITGVSAPVTTGGVTPDDVLLGAGPGTIRDTFRCYIDQRQLPHALSVERRFHVPGEDAVYAMIFEGTDLTVNPKIISSFFDTQGNLLGQKVPLVLVAYDNSQGTNIAVKSIPTCWTTEPLATGSVVTVVAYSTLDIVVSIWTFIVQNSGFIPSPNLAAKYVTDISLDSPFMSTSDATLIQYPINVPLGGLNLMGTVHYSDGSTLQMPVDGTKFSVEGLDAYITTIIGQQAPIVLTYTLSSDEICYDTQVNNNRTISKDYRAQTEQVDGSYSVKLYGYPVWVDSITGYRLEWYLANLERTAIFHATPYVKINANTGAWQPLAYGINQNLSVTVDLADINPSLGHYLHTQTVSFVLMAAGTDRSSNGNWTVAFDPGQSPPFGVQNAALTTFVSQNTWKVKVDLGEATQASWLNRLYANTRPLFNPSTEAAAPTPTHFAFVFNDQTLEFPIGEWNVEHVISHSVLNSDTLFIQFFQRTPDNDIELSMAAMPVYQQN